IPAPHPAQLGIGPAPEEGWTHHTDDLAQQFLLAAQAALNFDYQVFGEAQVMERLFQELGGVLRLVAVTLLALLRCESTALSGFGVFFCPSFGWGHEALLYTGWVLYR